MNKRRTRIVVLGGGHGQAAICRGIKKIEDAEITAIVTVADDGGSTGRLRRQFHIPAMGDIRNVMISLAESETMLGNLMDYRFEDPSGLEADVSGHNLGNLILTALTDQCGSFLEAVSMISSVLRVKGSIIPATTQVITLFARMNDGVIVRGEANIPNLNNHIRSVFYDCEVHATPSAVEAIRNADLIIYGIGSVYTSILPNVIIPEIRSALQESSALRLYFCNAMTQPGETDGYMMEDHVKALADHGAPADAVLMADDAIPPEIAERYERMGSMIVRQRNAAPGIHVISRSLLRFDNGLIRHDPEKIREAVEYVMEM